MARAMVASWRITKNAGTARQRFSSYEASAKKRRSGTWRIISPCNSLTFAPQRAQNLTNSSKSEAGRPLNMPMRRSRSGERFPACPVPGNVPRKTPTPAAGTREETQTRHAGPTPGGAPHPPHARTCRNDISRSGRASPPHSDFYARLGRWSIH